MGFMDRILGDQSRSTGDYVEIDAEDLNTEAEADTLVYVAEIAGQQDVMAIKDAVYDGDLVIADITRMTTEDRTTEHVIDELRQVAEEVGGDIAHASDDQLIVAPGGVKISRQKLNRD